MFLLKVVIAVYGMAAVLWITMGAPAEWLAAGAAQRAARLTWVVAAGAASYFAALGLLGFRVRDFVRRAVE